MTHIRSNVTLAFSLLFFTLTLNHSIFSQNNDEILGSAEKTFDEAVELSKVNKDEMVPQALLKFQSAQKLYQRGGDKRGEANAFRGIGKSYLSLKNKAEAINAYKEALRLFEEIQRAPGIITTSLELGHIFAESLDEKELLQALDHYKRALTFLEKADDKREIAFTRSSLGRVYLILRNPKESLANFEQALPAFRAYDDRLIRAGIWSFMGNAHDITNDSQNRSKSLEFFNKALDVYSTIDTKEAKIGKANALLNAGNAYQFFNEREKAIKSYVSALGLYRELESPSDIAVTLDNLGLIYSFSNSEADIRQAIDFYTESSRIYLDTYKEKRAGAETLGKIGDLFFRLKNKAQTLKYYGQTQSIYQELGQGDYSFKRGVARGFVVTGIAFEYLGDENEKALAGDNYRKAQSMFQEANEYFIKNDDKGSRLGVIKDLADVYIRLKDGSHAVEMYKQGITVCRNIKDLVCESDMLAAIANTYFMSDESGDNRLAISYFQMARDLFRKNGNKNAEIWALHQIASAQKFLGDWKAFSATCLELINVAETLELKSREFLKGEVYIRMGEALKAKGDDKGATQKFELALSIGDQLKNKKLQVDALEALLELYFGAGNWETFLSRSERLISLVDPDDPEHMKTGVSVRIKRSAAYSALGDKTKAFEEVQMAGPLLKGLDDPTAKDMEKILKGHSYLSLEPDAKSSVTTDIEKILLEVKGEDAKIMALYYLTINAGLADDIDKALEYGQQVLTLSRARHYLAGEGMGLFLLGTIKSGNDEPEEGILLLKQALTLFSEQSMKPLEAYILTSMTMASDELEKPSQAVFYGKLAVKIFQEMRGTTQTLDPELQKSYLARMNTLYKNLTRILIEQGRFDEAQQVINLSRDQEFFDINDSHNRNLPEIQFTPSEEENYQLWKTELEKTRSALGEFDLARSSKGNSNSESVKKLQQLEDIYIKNRDSYFSTLRKIEANFLLPASEKDKAFIVSDVNSLQDTLNDLQVSTRENIALLSTLTGDDKFYILLCLPGEKVKVYESEIDAEEFNGKILQFYALLQSRSYDPRLLGKELYDVIIPVKLADTLEKRNVKTLMWSLDGGLRYIPMAALSPDGKKYLVERFNNVMFTRADKTRLLQPAGFDWTGYGFFASSPPNFEPIDKDEIRIFRTEGNPQGTIEGDVFSEAAFTDRALFNITKKRRPLVHISSHFVFFPGDLDRSFLVLGNGDKLPLSKIRQNTDLFKDVELLTLSACNTAAQFPNADGKEIDAFAALAQRLGTRSVLASLWSVSDISTTSLMKSFYRNRREDKLNKADALSRSQLDLLYGRNLGTLSPASKEVDNTKGNSIIERIVVEKKYRIPFQSNNRFAHPYYWSPFILFGNWR